MEQKLNKSWKAKMLAAVAGASLPALSQDVAQTPEPIVEQEQKKIFTPDDYSVPFGQHPADKYLKSIKFLESSGGKNLDHTTMETGIHAGTAAIGRFGLMPKTIKDLNSMIHGKSHTYLGRKLGEHYKDEDMRELASLPDNRIQDKLKQKPILGLKAARYLWDHLMERHKGDPAKSAFGWRFGTNIPSSKITPKHLQDSGYVKKFNQLLLEQGVKEPTLELK